MAQQIPVSVVLTRSSRPVYLDGQQVGRTDDRGMSPAACAPGTPPANCPYVTANWSKADQVPLGHHRVRAGEAPEVSVWIAKPGQGFAVDYTGSLPVAHVTGRLEPAEARRLGYTPLEEWMAHLPSLPAVVAGGSTLPGQERVEPAIVQSGVTYTAPDGQRYTVGQRASDGELIAGPVVSTPSALDAGPVVYGPPVPVLPGSGSIGSLLPTSTAGGLSATAKAAVAGLVLGAVAALGIWATHKRGG